MSQLTSINVVFRNSWSSVSFEQRWHDLLTKDIYAHPFRHSLNDDWRPERVCHLSLATRALFGRSFRASKSGMLPLFYASSILRYQVDELRCCISAWGEVEHWINFEIAVECSRMPSYQSFAASTTSFLAHTLTYYNPTLTLCLRKLDQLLFGDFRIGGFTPVRKRT